MNEVNLQSKFSIQFYFRQLNDKLESTECELTVSHKLHATHLQSTQPFQEQFTGNNVSSSDNMIR